MWPVEWVYYMGKRPECSSEISVFGRLKHENSVAEGSRRRKAAHIMVAREEVGRRHALLGQAPANLPLTRLLLLTTSLL